MAHDLATIGGKTAMMYVDNPPWHGLGTQLNQPATAAEAIKAANLDWRVGKFPVFVQARRDFKRVPGRHGIARLDENGNPIMPIFGIVAEGYQPLQNVSAFEWFDSIVGQSAAIYHTAGALGQGERVWILAKLPGQIRVRGDDLVDKFLLLSNCHDGEGSVFLKFTPIRVVCQNTLTMALRAGKNVRVSHRSGLKERLESAKSTLGIIKNEFAAMEGKFIRMAGVQMTGTLLDDYLRAVFPEPSDKEDLQGRNRAIDLRERARGWFEKGRGNAESEVSGTLWAAYNGVAELIDHHLEGRTPETRLESIWFGNGSRVKAKAYDIAVQMADGSRN